MITNYENCKKKLEIAEIARTESAIVRSRVKWMDEGERNTKFFLNLEKKRTTINIIYEIKNEQREICKHPTKILSEIQKHFKDIYKKDEPITNVEEQLNDFMQDTQHEVLGEENKEFCDSEITKKEMSEALKCLNNKSAPGSDGLAADPYKVF